MEIIQEHEEPWLLNWFWRTATDPGTDRLSLLVHMGTFRIERPATWDINAVRAAIGWEGLTADRCFGCRSDREWQWHHVIWVRNGGSNGKRNYVRLCRRCHGAIHGFAVYGKTHSDETWFTLFDITKVPRRKDTA